MNEERIKNHWNSSILKHIPAILGLAMLFSCTEKKNPDLIAITQHVAPIALHKSLLSDLATTNKPTQVFIDKVPSPKTELLVEPAIKNSASLATHLFLDSLTGLPVSEDAQGKGLFSTYTTDEGLALDQIYCSYKDKNGNLWFGTSGGGVSKYDGKTFTNYTKLQGLANNVVWSILEDKNGNLWFGTDGSGVSKYDGKVFTNYSVIQGLANDVVFSIKEDKKGNLWFGTLKGGVSKYDGKTFTNYSTEQGLPNNAVRDIIEDNDGTMWFGTLGGGLSRFDGKHFTTYTTADGLSNDTIRSIHQDKKGRIWLATDGGGLCEYDGSKFICYTTMQGLASNKVWTVTEDNKGNIWAGTNGGGASKFDGQRFTNYTTLQGLVNNNVRCITEDERGNIWFGTFGGGVCKFEGKSFSNYTKAQGLPNNVVYSITEDNSGNLWLGTFGAGVCRYDRKSFTCYNTAQGLINNLIYCTAKDSKGNLWLGTFEGGVIKSDGKRFSNYTTEQGLANNVVFCIKEDRSGNLWFGTSGGGVSKFDGKSFTNFTKDQGLPDNEVFCITEDKKGNLWFGTSGAGICRFDGKSLTNFSVDQGLADNMVWAITEDNDGNIWVGTQQGLSVMPQKKADMLQQIVGNDTMLAEPLFQSFTNKDGLPDNFITQVVQGDDQKLYIGTNLGICELIPGAAANAPEKQWHAGRIFNSHTGYPVKDVNAGSGAMFKDSRGIIWIGTGSDKTGLVRFDPKAEITNSDKPPVVVIQSIKINQESPIWNDLDTTFTVQAVKAMHTAPNIAEEINAFGRPLTDAERNTDREKFGDISFRGIRSWYPIPENLVLPYDKNSISFDFNAIETGKNHLVKYQYMLVGYDKDWNPAGDKSTATFGNIYEGSYTFKVRAQSPEGLWSQPLSYTFRVLPPWWRTWWMYVLYAVIIGSAIVFIFRWNTKRIIYQKNVLERKVALATTQIREEKENVEAQKKIVEDTLKVLESAQAQLIQAEKMASLGELTAGIAHEIQNPLNFVTNFSDINKELIDEQIEELKAGRIEDAIAIADDIKQNEAKINQHGKRADAIVKGMLQHSRTNPGAQEPVAINKFADEYLRISYHGLRAKDKEFNVTIKTEFDDTIGSVNMVPQDIGRVLLNLFNNAFFAVKQRQKNTGDATYEPTIVVATKKQPGKTEIIISDNGTGIPAGIVDKIFQPFFTTKSSGEGTGLGLSLSYDIIKAHGGEIKVKSKEGEGTEFIIQLPNK